MARDFVLEIGTEEIPARFMPPALAELKESAATLLAKERLQAGTIATYGTPRRLVVYIHGLEEKQADLEEEIKGPPVKAAFDSEGNPTKAAEGFARSQGIAVDELKILEAGGNPYVFALRRQKGKPTAEILQQLAPQMIKGLNFPKPMRWGNNDVRFARPIRWLLSLYGNEVIKFTYADVESGGCSRGHRFLSQGNVEVAAAEEYFEKLHEAYVIVDQNMRREMIWQQINRIAVQEGGVVKEDAALLEEITYLLEYPAALSGNFSEDYLKLPEEVLVTSMREHQRYFPVFGKDGKMLAKFITVRNGIQEHIDIVREGNEKVLRARLADASFFYDEDRKTSLSDKVDRLKNVVYQEQLGTVFEKCCRLQNLVRFMADRLELDSPTSEAVHRAAYLSKADLVTSMVIEFPELQGVMGSYYSAYDGEGNSVAQALREQYLPRFSGDVLPETYPGCLLSIADKMDNIVGSFALGHQPTGSQDPYALRRQALGVCNIILKFKLNLTFSELFRETYNQYAEKVTFSLTVEEIEKAVMEFFRQRVVNIMEDTGLRHDTVLAAMSVCWDNLPDLADRAQALDEFRQDADFEALLTGFTRATNLAKKAQGDNIDPNLFEDAAEGKLYSALVEISHRAGQEIIRRNYLLALREIAGLRAYIDGFFESVMVMAEDEKVRNNRLALLAAVSKFMGSVADLSQVVPTQ